VFDAVKMLEVDVLPSSQEYRPEDPHDVTAAFLSQLDEICRLIWKRVRRWYAEARYATTKEKRAEAADNLKHLGCTLAGDQRGKRRKIVIRPLRVEPYYRRMLFRLLRADHLLEGCGSAVAPQRER
jgi:hypothetical protein